MSNKLHNSKWQAKWIGRPSFPLVAWRPLDLSSPFFRRVIECKKKKYSDFKVRISGLGYYILYINGEKISDELSPVPTCYDKTVLYLIYDITEYIRDGKNVIGVILGNGLYNCYCPPSDPWDFDKASWRDYPKLIMQIEAESEIITYTDSSWKVTSGPIVSNSLRIGEVYDATRELDGWLTPDYDDSFWEQAVIVSPPGGTLKRQKMPPCKIMRTIPYHTEWETSGGTRVYDFGQNMAGRVEITVSGERNSEVIIKYAEQLTDEGDIDQSNIKEWEGFQTDRYILKGKNKEVWHPNFTYHGFRYAGISIKGNAEIIDTKAQIIHTAFEKIGDFSCSDEKLNRLQECTVHSYLSNFVGIPTDCPHREKNGWTGDAHLAAETGLFNFNVASSYIQWLDTLVDCQRKSGQLPGIAPSSGWGFNWGSGPAWDSAIILIPWYIYIYTGNLNVIKRYYKAMKKYVDYCSYMAENNIVSFGLGDWSHPKRRTPEENEAIVETPLTSTAYYYTDTLLIAKFASLLNKPQDERSYSNRAKKIRNAFNTRFYKGNGIYGRGEITALACALYHGLVEKSEKERTFLQLVSAVKENEFKSIFGILGAKYILRVLSDYGRPDLAFRIITNQKFPGWGYWLNKGATTLWEKWNGSTSKNHIMFGDISAWMYQYIAGIVPTPKYAGFSKIFLRPNFVSGLEYASAKYKTPRGEIKIKWERKKTSIHLNLKIPRKTTAVLFTPDGNSEEIKQGEVKRIFQLS